MKYILKYLLIYLLKYLLKEILMFYGSACQLYNDYEMPHLISFIMSLIIAFILTGPQLFLYPMAVGVDRLMT